MKGRNLLADDDNESPQQDQPQGKNLLAEPEKESYWDSIKMAAPRMILDAADNAYQGIQNIPNRIQQAKTEVPGLYNLMSQQNPQGQTGFNQLGKFAAFGSPLHPGETGKQAMAGIAELGQNLIDMPQKVADYATKRLNLLPENINDYIQKLKMPGAAPAQESIDKYFGTPKEPGQALIRGTARNLDKIIPASSLLSTMNPMRLRSANIANRVAREGDRQVGYHNKLYNALWKDAGQQGITHVNYDLGKLQSDFNVISKYKTPNDYNSIIKFSNDPSLSNAQTALIDIRKMQRKLEEKSSKDTLTGEDKALSKALNSTENHIEDNMFKDKNGNKNQNLLNKYKYINNSYRENVVPYKYNDALQDYNDALPKNRGRIAKKTVDSLKNDIHFLGKKAHMHPELFRPDELKTILKNTGIGGAAIGGLGAGAAGLGYLSGLGQKTE